MNGTESSPWEIHPISPHGFVEQYRTFLRLHYAIENNIYIFRYKSAKVQVGLPAFSREWEEALEESLDRSGWVTFMRGEEYIAEIDIDIRDGDTTVFVETVDVEPFNNMYWSTTRSAIKTGQFRQGVFGNLHYWNGRKWKREKQENCRRIFFEARYNDRIYREEKHKFSFNVILPVRGEFEIDPDIKNPSA